jgi:hypothetical protein
MLFCFFQKSCKFIILNQIILQFKILKVFFTIKNYKIHKSIPLPQVPSQNIAPYSKVLGVLPTSEKEQHFFYQF